MSRTARSDWLRERGMKSPLTPVTGLRAHRQATVVHFVVRLKISHKAIWDFFDSIDPKRTFPLDWQGLQPESLSQKKIDLLEEPSSGGFVFQKEVIPPGKRDEASVWNPSRHLTARIDRGNKITTRMHDKRWHLHLREQFAHIEVSHGFKIASGAFC